MSVVSLTAKEPGTLLKANLESNIQTSSGLDVLLIFSPSFLILPSSKESKAFLISFNSSKLFISPIDILDVSILFFSNWYAVFLNASLYSSFDIISINSGVLARCVYSSLLFNFKFSIKSIAILKYLLNSSPVDTTCIFSSEYPSFLKIEISVLVVVPFPDTGSPDKDIILFFIFSFILYISYKTIYSKNILTYYVNYVN